MTLVYTGWTIPEKAVVQIEEVNRNGTSTNTSSANHVQRTQVMSWSYCDNAVSALYTHTDANSDSTSQLRGCCVVTLYILSECNEKEHEIYNNITKMKGNDCNDNNKRKSNDPHQTGHEKMKESAKEQINISNKVENTENEISDKIIGVEWELHFLPTLLQQEIANEQKEDNGVKQERVEYRATYRFIGSHYRVTPSTLTGTSGVIFLSSHDVLIQTRNTQQEEQESDLLSLDRFTLVEQSLREKYEFHNESPNTNKKMSESNEPQTSFRCNWIRHAKEWSILEILQNASVSEELENILTKDNLWESEEECKQYKWKQELVLCTALPSICNIITMNDSKNEENKQHVLFVVSKRLCLVEELEREEQHMSNEHHLNSINNHKSNMRQTFMAGVIEVKANASTKELESELVHFTWINNNHNNNDNHENNNNCSWSWFSNELQELRPEEWIWMYLPSHQIMLNLELEEEVMLHFDESNAKNHSHDNFEKDSSKNNCAHGCIVALRTNQHECSAHDAINKSSTINTPSQTTTSTGVVMHSGKVCCNTNSIVNKNTEINLALSFCHPNLTLHEKPEEECFECLEEQYTKVPTTTNESNKCNSASVDSNHRNSPLKQSKDVVNQFLITNKKYINGCICANRLVHMLTYTRGSNDDITDVNNSKLHEKTQISKASREKDIKRKMYNVEESQWEVDLNNLQELSVFELSVEFVESPCTKSIPHSACNNVKMQEGLHKLQLHAAHAVHVPSNAIWIDNTPFTQENKTRHTYTPSPVEVNKNYKNWHRTPLPQVSCRYSTELDTYECMYNTIIFNNSSVIVSAANADNSKAVVHALNASTASSIQGNMDIMCVHNQIGQYNRRNNNTIVNKNQNDNITRKEADKNTLTTSESSHNKSLELLFCTRHSDFAQWLSVRAMEEYHSLIYSACANDKNKSSKRTKKGSKDIASQILCLTSSFVLHELWQYALEKMNANYKLELAILLKELEKTMSTHTWTKSTFVSFSEYIKEIRHSTLTAMCSTASALESEKYKYESMLWAFAHLLRRAYLQFLVSLDWITVTSSDRKLLKHMVMFYLGINTEKQTLNKVRSEESLMEDHVDTIEVLLHAAAFGECISQNNGTLNTFMNKDDNVFESSSGNEKVEVEKWFRRNLLLYVHLSEDAILELMLSNLSDYVELASENEEPQKNENDYSYKSNYVQSKTERLTMEFALLNAVDVKELWNTIRQHTKTNKHGYEYYNSVQKELMSEYYNSNYLTWYDWHSLLCTWDADNLQMLYQITVHDDKEIDVEEKYSMNESNNHSNSKTVSSLIVLMWCVDLICRLNSKNNKWQQFAERTWEESEEEEYERYHGDISTDHKETVEELQKEIKESLLRWEQIISPHTLSEAENDNNASSRKKECEMNRKKMVMEIIISFPEQWMHLTLHDLDYFPFHALPPLASILIMQHFLRENLFVLHFNINEHNNNNDKYVKLHDLSKYKHLATLYKSWSALRWLTSDSKECSKFVFNSLHELSTVCPKHRFNCLPIAAFAELFNLVSTDNDTNLLKSEQWHTLGREQKECNREQNNEEVDTNDERALSRNGLLVLQCLHRLWASATSPVLRLQMSRALLYCDEMEIQSSEEPLSFAQDAPQLTSSNVKPEVIHETSTWNKEHFSSWMEKQLSTEYEYSKHTFQQFIAVWELVWCAAGSKIITNTVMYEKFLEAVMSILEEYKRNNENTNNYMKGQCENQHNNHTILFDNLHSRVFVLLRPIYMHCMPKLTQKLMQSIEEGNNKLYVQYDACSHTGTSQSFAKLPIEEVCHRVSDIMIRLCTLLAPVNHSFTCLSQFTRLLYEQSNTLINRELLTKCVHSSITYKRRLESKSKERLKMKKEGSVRNLWEELLMSYLQPMFPQQVHVNNSSKKKKMEIYKHEEKEREEYNLSKYDFSNDRKMGCTLTFTPSHRTCYFVSKLQEYNSTRVGDNNDRAHDNQNFLTSFTSLTLIMESLRRELLCFTLFDLLRVKWIRVVEHLQTSEQQQEHEEKQQQEQDPPYSNIDQSVENNLEQRRIVVLEVTSLFTPEDAFNTLASQTEGLSHILSEEVSTVYDKAIIMLLLDVMFCLFANTNLETDVEGNNENNNNNNSSNVIKSENVTNDNTNNKKNCVERIKSSDHYQHKKQQLEELQCENDVLFQMNSEVQSISVDTNSLVCSRCILPMTSSSSPHSSWTSPIITLKVQSRSAFAEEMKRCILYIAQNALHNISEQFARPLLCSLTQEFQNFIYHSLLPSKLDWFVCLQENVICTRDAQNNRSHRNETTNAIDTSTLYTNKTHKQLTQLNKLHYVKSDFHEYMVNDITQILVYDINNLLPTPNYLNENIYKREEENRLEKEQLNKAQERHDDESEIYNLTKVQLQQQEEEEELNELNALFNFANQLSNTLWNVNGESYKNDDNKNIANSAINTKENANTSRFYSTKEVQRKKEICTSSPTPSHTKELEPLREQFTNELVNKNNESEFTSNAEMNAKHLNSINYNGDTETGSLFAPSSLTHHLLTTVGKHIAPTPRFQKEALQVKCGKEHANEEFKTIKISFLDDKANTVSTESTIQEQQESQESTPDTEHTTPIPFANTNYTVANIEGKDTSYISKHDVEKKVYSSIKKSKQPMQYYQSNIMDILLLTKEEEARRRKLTEMLLQEYYNNVMYNTGNKLTHNTRSSNYKFNRNTEYNEMTESSERNISMELQELYLTLRCERRRRELEWYAEEQKDLILTFCSKIHAQYLREIRLALRTVLIDIAERCAAEFKMLHIEEHNTRRAIEEEFLYTFDVMKSEIRSSFAFVRDEDEMRQVMAERENDLWNAMIDAFDLETSYILKKMIEEDENAWQETDPFYIVSGSELHKTHVMSEDTNSSNYGRRGEVMQREMECQQEHRSEQAIWNKKPGRQEQMEIDKTHKFLPQHTKKELQEHPIKDNSGPSFDRMAEAGANLWHAFGKLQTKLRETVAPAPVQGVNIHKLPSTHFESPFFESSSTFLQKEKEEQWQNAKANNITTASYHEIHSATWQAKMTLPSSETSVSSLFQERKDENDGWNDEEGWEDVDVIVPTNAPISNEIIQSSQTTSELFKQKGSDALTTRDDEVGNEITEVNTINTDNYSHSNSKGNNANTKDDNNVEKESNKCANVDETNVNDEVEVIDIGHAKTKLNAQGNNGPHRTKHTKRKMFATRIVASELLMPNLMSPSAATNTVNAQESGLNTTNSANNTIKINAFSETSVLDDKKPRATSENCVQHTTSLLHNQETEKVEERTTTNQTGLQAALAEQIQQQEISNRKYILMDESYNKHILLRYIVLNKE